MSASGPEAGRVNDQTIGLSGVSDTQEPKYRVRARHTASTVTVYQAYRPEIGLPAARAGRFPATWKRDRMTWVIKPCRQTIGRC